MVDTDDTRRTTDDGHWTTPRVWHKLPTGELKIHSYIVNCPAYSTYKEEAIL